MARQAAFGPVDPGLLHRVEHLQRSYVHCLDDGELERWPDFFTPSCLYTIIARDNVERDMELGVMRFETAGMLRDRAVATAHAAVFAPRRIRHVLGGALIDASGDSGVRARTNVAIYHTSADGDTLLLMVAEYQDLIVEQDGIFLFREKKVVYDTLRLPDSVVYPL